MRTNQSFFSRKAEHVARDLIGMKLVRNLEGRILSGIITETEAHPIEPKITPKVEGAFAHPGTIHMYPAQGKLVLAIATERGNKYSEISIRALEPLDGIEHMKRYRETNDCKNLANGPGKLVQALHITKNFNGDFIYNNSELWIEGKPAENVQELTGKANDASSYFKMI